MCVCVCVCVCVCWYVCVCVCVCFCKASEVGGYSMEKNYCYLPGRRGKRGGDKKLLQPTEREKERERERIRRVRSRVSMGAAVVNLQDIQSELALLV